MADNSSFTPNDSSLVAREGDGDNARAYSITEISGLLKRTVEDRFGFVRVRGEISRVSRPRSGHVYTTLKDDKANLDAIIWKGNAGRLNFEPEEGLEVVATGKLTTYPGQSKYQIVIEKMELAGEGALLALLEKTKARLEAEGLFAPERKRALPFVPRTIGVVTSPTGAVIRDILHRLADRFPTRVIVWPVLVQGKGAADQVANAVRGFSQLPVGHADRPDLVIVARGGGSIEDLWGFNEEAVVRAIAECSIPTISAVGHETDTTLADFAADKRAPTPTAAAEMAVPVRAELGAFLGDLGARSRTAIMRPVGLGRERLKARADRLPQPETLLQPQAQRLDEAAERLRRGLQDRASRGRERLSALRLSPAILRSGLRRSKERLGAVRLSAQLVERPLAERTARLAGAVRTMEALNPDAVVERGYVRVMGEHGKTLTDKAQAASEARLRLRFRDGELSVVNADGDAELSPSPGAALKPKNKPTAKPQTRSRPKKPSNDAQDDLFG
jgi:exodeoxyribonuclease VII large subunit